MVTEFFVRLLSAFARKRVQKCASKMMQLDDYILRDIGLTQKDVVNCMASPAHMADGCLPARRSENLDTHAAAAKTAAAAQAAPPAGGLAA